MVDVALRRVREAHRGEQRLVVGFSPRLVYLTVTDAPPVETCLAVPEDSRTGPVPDFLDIATATLRSTTLRSATPVRHSS
ncbi:hypothetical protein ABZ545_25835 [Streptomyces abikoensis]|uniref:Uncharacterized protein n=1 Tax=Streptomyces abikoensis TaxID=97398 RepID=A0ABW7TA35_9ACTN